MKERTCPICQATFARRKRIIRYCGKRCAALARHGTPWDQYTGPYHSSGVCRHCHRTTYLAARGLCYPCYRDTTIRRLWPEFPTGPKRQLHPINCLVCKATFQPVNLKQRYCSKPCGALGQHEIGWEDYLARRAEIEVRRKRQREITVRGSCAQCDQIRRLRSRGLCRACFNNVQIRHHWPTAKRGRKPRPPSGAYTVETRNELVMKYVDVAERIGSALWRRKWYANDVTQREDVVQWAIQDMIGLIDRHDPVAHPDLEAWLFIRIKSRTWRRLHEAFDEVYRADLKLLHRRLFNLRKSMHTGSSK